MSHSNHDHGYALDPQPRRTIGHSQRQLTSISELFINKTSRVLVNHSDEEGVIRNPRVRQCPCPLDSKETFRIMAAMQRLTTNCQRTSNKRVQHM